MTRFVMFKGTIYDLEDGSLKTDGPVHKHQCYDIWSAEALLCKIAASTQTEFIKPFYFLDVID